MKASKPHYHIQFVAIFIQGIVIATAQWIKAELNPKAAILNLYTYLVPFLVLNNIPKCKKSQSNHFLTTPIYIHTGGIADPWADWAMISNRPGKNIKREAAHHYLQSNQVLFSQVYLILLSGHLFLHPPSVVGSVVAWTLDSSGYVWALEKVSYQLINPTYMFKGLSSALNFFWLKYGFGSYQPTLNEIV